MDDLIPGGPHYIEGLSDHSVSDVCDLLLSFTSVLGPRGPFHARASKVLFPDEAFVHPGGIMGHLWSECWRIMDNIGLYLTAGGIDDGRWGLSDGDWQFLQSYRIAFKAAAMESLFPGARKVLVLMSGPEPFTPSGKRLRDIDPYFLPSRRLARYIRDVTGKDIEPAIWYAERLISMTTVQVTETFPRIAKFTG